MTKRSFGELEWTLLRLVRQNGPITVRQVFDALGRKGSYTTIMTVMTRLAEKGELFREKKGKQYIYTAHTEQTPNSFPLLKKLKELFFGGDGGALVSHFLKQEVLSTQELEELAALIEEKKREQGPDHG